MKLNHKTIVDINSYFTTSCGENVILIGRLGAYYGSIYSELGKCWISDNAISVNSKINFNMYTCYLLRDLKLNERREGTGRPLITQVLLKRIVIPKLIIE